MPHTFVSYPKPVHVPIQGNHNDIFASLSPSAHSQSGNTSLTNSNTISSAPSFTNINSNKEQNFAYNNPYIVPNTSQKQDKNHTTITHVYTKKNLTKQKKVKVSVQEIENNVLLLRGEAHAKNVVISAHGSHDPDDNDDIIELKPGMPEIVFLSPHNYSLNDEPFWGVTEPYATVTDQGITACSEHAQQALFSGEEGQEEITGTDEPGAIRNYHLSLFTLSQKKLDDLKVNDYLEIEASQVDTLNKTSLRCDLYVVKNNQAVISLRDLIEHAMKMGYKRIFCCFCRTGSNITDKDNIDDYLYRDKKLLSTPTFKSWQEIIEMTDD